MAPRDHTRISHETRQRILLIARRLNYQFNFVARSLVMEKTNTFGIIITSIFHLFIRNWQGARGENVEKI